MRTLSAWLVVFAAVGLLAGCKDIMDKIRGGPPEVKPPEVQPPEVKPPPGELVLEVEAFTKLEEAQVKDLAGASGGKAVFFDSETSAAETSVPLTKGTWEVTLFMQGTDEDQDAVYLDVAGTEQRLFPQDYGKVMAVEPFTVEVAKDGAVKVVLMAAETGVYLDKVVLKKVK